MPCLPGRENLDGRTRRKPGPLVLQGMGLSVASVADRYDPARQVCGQILPDGFLRIVKGSGKLLLPFNRILDSGHAQMYVTIAKSW
jgi:hypothetical protein